MRRPLCVFCAGMLGVALVCAFLPQTELFVPFAAFFVAVCLLLCIPDRTRKAVLCLLLGAAAGLAAARHTNARLEQTLEKYAGQTVALTAEVESVSASYYPGIVDAVLRVERVNGRAVKPGSGWRGALHWKRRSLPIVQPSLPTALYCGQGSRRLLPGWAKAAASGRAPAACKSGSVPACAVR